MFSLRRGHHRIFYPLTTKLRNIETWAYEPPGHLYTSGEPYHDLPSLCQLYLQQTPQTVFDTELILLGHSFGAYVAFEFASQLLTLNPFLKIRLILCAAHPPSQCRASPLLCEMPKQKLLATLVEKGYLDERLLSSPEVMDFFYPSLNADLMMYEHFVFPNNISHLDTQIILAYDDKMICAEESFLWKSFFTDCTIDWVAGNHLFINNEEPIQRLVQLIDFCQRKENHYLFEVF